METLDQKNERNRRVQARYDELMREGKHGHYETLFRVVREEVERERLAANATDKEGALARAIKTARGGDAPPPPFGGWA